MPKTTISKKPILKNIEQLISVELVEVIVPLEVASRDNISQIGYGRDIPEARIHAGLSERLWEGEKYRVVTVRNLPETVDKKSEKVCMEICRYHLHDDPEIHPALKVCLRELVKNRLYASAIRFCFLQVWDRGFEYDEDL